MKVLPLPRHITNFQVGYIPESLLTRWGTDGRGDEISSSCSEPEKFISLPINGGRRRVLVRCSLCRPPEDGPDVIWCDTRVQQILRRRNPGNRSVSARKEEGEKKDDIPVTSCERLDGKNDEVGDVSGDGGGGVGPPAERLEYQKEQMEMDAKREAQNKNILISGGAGESECVLKGSSFPRTAPAITTCSSPRDGPDDEFYEDGDGASQESKETTRVARGRREEVEDLNLKLTTSTSTTITGGGDGGGRCWESENDYYGEIDLAHHIVEMEKEEDGDDKRSGVKKKYVLSGSDEQQLPSTVRFNDAVACTSKDAQILKSGAIKMMRLTVICHSDLHYQNHSEKLYDDGNHRSDDSLESCFRRNGKRTTTTTSTGIGTAAKAKEQTTRLLFAKPSSTTTRATTVYSSSTSSFSESESSSSAKATFEGGRLGISKRGEEELFSDDSIGITPLHHTLHEREEKLDEKCVPFPSTTLTSSHQHSNQDEEDLFTQSVTETGEKSKHFMKSFFPSSSSPSPYSSPSSKGVEMKGGNRKNWKRLENKIRNVFQTYDIHVTGSTLVDLKSCPLASIHSNFSPAVSFVFVEECEMRSTTTNTATRSSSDSSKRTTIGRVTGKTEIIIANVHHISHYRRLLEQEESRRRGSTHLFGLEEPAKILHSVMLIGMLGMSPTTTSSTSPYPHVTCRSELVAEFSHGLLISGPAGCGKTVVVRETAKKVGAHLMSFNLAGLVQEDVSRFCEKLTEIFTSAVVTASRYPTVLYLPRIHLLFQGRDKKSSGFGEAVGRRFRERVLHHLCNLFDSIHPGLALTVVGSTDKSFLVPLELRRARRLEKEIIIYPPKESDRFQILQELCRKSPPFSGVDLKEVARQTPGYVPQDLEKLVRLALFKSQEEDCSQVSEHHVKYAVGRVLPSVLEGSMGVVDIQRAVSLDHIAGLHSVKLDLIKAIVWPLNHPQSFLRMGISPSKGILLYGPPGNCKTTLVRALAASHHTNFLSVSAAELFSSGVGDSEKIVAHLFHRARIASPCILFIDELESIVGSRHNSEKKQTSTNESILSMLLTEMDGVGISGFSSRNSSKGITGTESNEKGGDDDDLKLGPLVLVVAATNRPDLIDPALLRPGRFDKLIGVPPLDLNGRLELLQFCSKSIPFNSDVNFEEIAEETEYYSGADLVNLCKEAAINALTEDMGAPFVKYEHLKEARAIMSPSLTPAMVRAFYEYGTGAASI